MGRFLVALQHLKGPGNWLMCIVCFCSYKSRSFCCVSAWLCMLCSHLCANMLCTHSNKRPCLPRDLHAVVSEAKTRSHCVHHNPFSVCAVWKTRMFMYAILARPLTALQQEMAQRCPAVLSQQSTLVHLFMLMLLTYICVRLPKQHIWAP